MLRTRVIPIVLLNNYSVLKTINFNIRRNLGNPIVIARVYNTRNVDELVLLDIDASKENRKIDVYTINDIASECFMPLTVGGGLKTCEDIAEVLSYGADRVIINSEIFENPSIIKKSVEMFGSQCIIVSIDVKKENDNYIVFSHAGKKTILLNDCLKLAEDSGAGEILINSVDFDGTMRGYDLNLIKLVSASVKIPIIACGGASSADNCVLAINSGASAVAAASIFHFTSITPMDCKMALSAAGIPVRM